MAVPGRWVTRKHVESGKSGGLLQRFRRFRWKRTVPVDLNVPKKDQTPTGKPPDIFHSNFAYGNCIERSATTVVILLENLSHRTNFMAQSYSAIFQGMEMTIQLGQLGFPKHHPKHGG